MFFVDVGENEVMDCDMRFVFIGLEVVLFDFLSFMWIGFGINFGN